MASETMQSDPGDECDAAACSCGQRIDGSEFIPLPVAPMHFGPDAIYACNGRTSMTLAEIGEAIGVPGEDLVAIVRGQATIVPNAPAVQPEERKP